MDSPVRQAADPAASASRNSTAVGGWLAVATSAFALMFGPSVVLMLSFGILVPTLGAEFQWSPAEIAIGASIASLMLIPTSLVQGWMVDRLGARRVILWSLPLWGAGLILLQFLPGRLWVFYFAWAALVIAGFGLWPLSFMRIPTTWFERHLGLAIGLTNLGPGIGAATMPILLGSGFSAVGWRMTYALLGVFVLVVVMPCVYFWMREGRVNGEERTSDPAARRQPEAGSSLAHAARTRPFWITLGTFLVLGITGTGMLVHQIAILTDAGLPASRAVQIQSVMGIGTIIGRVGVGWLLDRLDVRVVGAGIFAAAMAACLLLASGNVGVAILAAAMLGLVIGAEFDLLTMLIRQYLGLNAFGRIYGVVFAVFQLGGAFGGAALGLGRAELDSYAPGLLVMAVILLASVGLFPLLGRPAFQLCKHEAAESTG